MPLSFENDYVVPLILKREDTTLTAGLCFSHISADKLHIDYPSFLHIQEQHYFETLQHLKRQYSYLLGRYCAKRAIALCVEAIRPVDICIQFGCFQQPVVEGADCNLQVSISHTDSMGGALAFPEAHPMGIDIEPICSDHFEHLAIPCTPHERLLAGKDLHTITLLWTVREALSKTLKCGFMVTHDLLEVASLDKQDAFTISYFKHFHQYKALSFLYADYMCSIVYPRNTFISYPLECINP